MIMRMNHRKYHKNDAVFGQTIVSCLFVPSISVFLFVPWNFLCSQWSPSLREVCSSLGGCRPTTTHTENRPVSQWHRTDVNEKSPYAGEGDTSAWLHLFPPLQLPLFRILRIPNVKVAVLLSCLICLMDLSCMNLSNFLLSLSC